MFVLQHRFFLVLVVLTKPYNFVIAEFADNVCKGKLDSSISSTFERVSTNAILDLYGPKEVLNWLNDLEYNTNKDPSKGPISQTKSDKIKEGEEWQNNEYTNIQCRSECQETSDNCCAFLQYKADKNRMQIQKMDNALERNIYKFNYQNDTMHLVGEVRNGFWHGIMTGYEKWFLTMNMTIIAKFNHGKLQGTVWRMLEENGYLVADNLEMTGPDVLYIYPG